jgi:hypothetical protein
LDLRQPLFLTQAGRQLDLVHGVFVLSFFFQAGIQSKHDGQDLSKARIQQISKISQAFRFHGALSLILLS